MPDTEAGPQSPPAPKQSQPTVPPGFSPDGLQSADSSKRLDELLPVTSLRLWLLALAAAILVGAAVAYTAVTPRNVIVAGEGRVVGDGGIGLVTSTADGQFGSFSVEPGSRVTVGQRIADIITESGPVPQYTQVEGTLLGYLPSPGAPLKVGDWIAQVTLKVDDGKIGLVTVLPADASKVKEGQPVKVAIVDGPTLVGHIGPERSGSLSAARIQEGLGTLDPPSGPRVAVEVLFDEPAPAGYEFSAQIMVSERTLLQQLLGLS
ncbi:MAG: hypothetical protein E6Q90_06125 [Actinobacteria bacterium]|nr:MAG: hypothetical protein E6Q90_06125 [Actinomycetota bacterium]